jgi:RNA polymerase sigma-70 factor, ECF subfamily
MNTTSVSLLERLRQPAEHDGAWRRFVQLYTPLLFHWARKLGLSAEDAADLVQEVLVLLVQKLPDFTYDPKKSFRGWLRTVTMNKWRDYQRLRRLPVEHGGAGQLDEMADDDGAAAFEEAEYRQRLVQQALNVMQSDFQPATWRACWEYMILERPAEVVAQELGLTVNAVYLANSRVLTRLRQELAGLLD